MVDIIVEYSSDMERRAHRLGGVLEHRGYRVVYRQVAGSRILRFRVDGMDYSWEEFDLMVRMALPRLPRAGTVRGS